MTCKFKLGLGLSVLFLIVTGSGCRSTLEPAPAARETPPAVAETVPIDGRQVILAFGDSLTEGYGLSKTQSWPALLQARLDAAGYPYRVVNAGISGDTSAGGAGRIADALKTANISILILELGANDMLRGQDLRVTRSNLEHIIRTATERRIEIILAGMKAPTNLGEDYQLEFQNLFPELARKYQLRLIPFLLEGVAGHPELNQGDGMHPNNEGVKLVEESVWKELQPLLKMQKKG